MATGGSPRGVVALHHCKINAVACPISLVMSVLIIPADIQYLLICIPPSERRYKTTY
jgi:hypothetical protein